VSASSVSGDVKVEINRLDGADEMKFNTVSGDVSVMLPSSLDADVDMSSHSGSIKTDFAIEVPRTIRLAQLGSRQARRRVAALEDVVGLGRYQPATSLI
jgi:DUF4097 and DUF4098 domain-containing protein YvlB